MKSFQAVIIAAILAAAAAANEPVASPTFFKQELAEYEHQLRNLQGSFSVQTAQPTPLRPVVPQSGSLGGTQTSRPQDPSRPSGVSNLFVFSTVAAAASHHSPTVHRCCAQVVFHGPVADLFDRFTHSHSIFLLSLSLSFTS